MHPQQISGVDFSLTGTGLATHQGQTTIKTAKHGDCIERAHAIAGEVHAATNNVGVISVIYLEAPIHMRFSQLELHQAIGAFQSQLHHSRGIVLVKPATLKKFATGKGNCNKDAMVKAAQQTLGYLGASHDEADAMWLREIGLTIHGLSSIELPARNLEALTAFDIEPHV